MGPDYAEIIVVRHGETEWNADGRIQVPIVLIWKLIVAKFIYLFSSDYFVRLDIDIYRAPCAHLASSSVKINYCIYTQPIW